MNENYAARIVRLTNVAPIPGADFLQKTSIMGAEYVIGLGPQVGDLMVLFVAGSQLSEPYCDSNNLRRNVVDGKNLGGMFDANRKVRAQTLRGVKSEGYLALVESLNYLNIPEVAALKEGDAFNELGGHPVSDKWVDPKTRTSNQPVRSSKHYPLFLEHVNTAQLRYVKTIPDGTLLTLTVKQHGTSHRSFTYMDKVPVVEVRNPSFLRRLFGAKPVSVTVGVTETKRTVTGTRRVVLSDTDMTSGYYQTNAFRHDATKKYAAGTVVNETVYGEIVGYLDDTADPIMSSVSTKPAGKEFAKKWGPTMTYKYGCPVGTSELYVYRITHTTDDGYPVELSWAQTKRRCLELGLKHSPEWFGYNGTAQMIWHNTPENTVEAFVKALYDLVDDVPDPSDASHLMEGVIVRADYPDGGTQFLKAKAYSFLVLESATDATEIEDVS